MFGTPFWRDDPRPVFPWRSMPNVLLMTALKVGYPIAVFVQMKAGDFPQRHLLQAKRKQRGARRNDHVLLPID